jgi:probable F420-dependent oxidoreductase
MTRPALGPVGVWAAGIWLEEARRAEAKELAAELEDLGFGSLWLSAGFESGVPALFGDLLAATERMAIATGILSIWHSTADQTTTAFWDLERSHPGRFLVGLGASHAPRVEDGGQRYNRPFSRMVGYLEALDDEQQAVPADRRVLAALGPRMLNLSAERAAGAHPYFVPVEHTAFARETLGPDALLVPEQGVVLESDPSAAREVARRHTSRYLSLPNYTNNLRRFGWGDDDLAAGGSDRLVDAIVSWGDVDDIAQRVQAHRDAGADSVCIQVLSPDATEFPREQYRRLASAVL